jgi:hypothetical protein
MSIYFIANIVIAIVIAWAFIWMFYIGNRGRQKAWRKIKCWCGNHAAGHVKGAVGGRNVQRCLYCDKIVYEYKVTKDSVRRKA